MNDWALLPIALYFAGIGIWLATERRGRARTRTAGPPSRTWSELSPSL
jgi:hypothetical protein